MGKVRHTLCGRRRRSLVVSARARWSPGLVRGWIETEMTHRSRTMMRRSMVAVGRVTSLAILLLLAFGSVTRALVLPHFSDATTSKLAAAQFDLAQNSNCRKESPAKSRRHFGAIVWGGLVAAVAPSILPAFADVSDGNVLPQGAQQFAKSLRLQKDVKVSTTHQNYGSIDGL
jgi:hypothetical protein